MLYVTHDQVEALTLGSRVAVLGGGRLQQVGTPLDVYRRPANRFVATFVGTPAMNIWPVVDGRAGPFPLDVGSAGGRVDAGIRPEHVALGGEIPARVDVVEEAGSETVVYLLSHGHQVVARVGAEARVERGETVGLAFRREHVHLFDGDSGVAL
jgi:ABC-type sugar transport system ATPase subunit